MNRVVQPNLMTLEEAQRLSDPRTSREAELERQKIWSFQTVGGMMSQKIDDELLDRLERQSRSRARK